MTCGIKMADVKVNIYEYAKRYDSRPATPRGGSISRLARSITSRIMRSRYWQSPSDRTTGVFAQLFVAIVEN